jgi:hypothetical protein
VGYGLGSHGERLSRRGLFLAAGQTHDELESKFVAATKAVSSPSVTKANSVSLHMT